jgi:hypothetical protein
MRRTADCTILDKKRKEHILEELQVGPIITYLQKYRAQWEWHMECMTDTGWQKLITSYKPPGKRSLGRPLKQWFETVLDYWEQGMIAWRRTILLSRDGVVGAIIVPSIRQFLLPLWPNTCRLFGVPLSSSKTQGKCEKVNVIILRFNARWTEGSFLWNISCDKRNQIIYWINNFT